MKALTLWRPWLWAIFHAPRNPKWVENRGRKPPASLIGQRFALHAGKRFDAGAVDFIEEEVGGQCPPKADHPTGIIGTARLSGWVETRVNNRWSPGLDASRVRDVLLSPWTMRGGFAWVLDDVVALPHAVECLGAQGLWNVPADILAEMENPSPRRLQPPPAVAPEPAEKPRSAQLVLL